MRIDGVIVGIFNLFCGFIFRLFIGWKYDKNDIYGVDDFLDADNDDFDNDDVDVDNNMDDNILLRFIEILDLCDINVISNVNIINNLKSICNIILFVSFVIGVFGMICDTLNIHIYGLNCLFVGWVVGWVVG